MHLNIFLVKKQHFGQTALEIPFTSFLMSRLLQFAKNHHQSRQIPTAIIEIMIHMIPMMKFSWITFKLNLAQRG